MSGMPHRAAVPAIELHGVSKRFGAGPAVLDNISLSIQRGEVVSILGPSGCGKSTLLRLVAGLSPMSSGLIAVDGMTPVNARETMSFIFQDATLLPWRTVRANIALGMELDHVARERRAAVTEEVLKLVNLEHVADSYPRQLSGGMKMRVSIARALASKPSVLLLDEPFAALDEMTRDHMNEELLRLRAEGGWTVLFVTHSVAEAVFLSGRIIVLAPHPGRIAEEILIDLPENRAGLRDTPTFEQTVARVSRALRSVEARR
jgi:NitT/TauT family transport system ATP-binding protein